jgi:hypothetical protein
MPFAKEKKGKKKNTAEMGLANGRLQSLGNLEVTRESKEHHHKRFKITL